MTPQIIFIVLTFLGIGHAIKEKGKNKTHNAISGVIATSLLQGLYYWGGFWSRGEWPQVIMSIFIGITITVGVVQHGKTEKSKGMSIGLTIGTVLSLVVLYFGHFFDPIIKFFSQQ